MWVGIEGRAQIIAPLQVGGIVAIVAVEAIEDIVDIVDVGFWGCGLGGMEEKKKSASPNKKLRLWGVAWAKRGARQKIV